MHNYTEGENTGKPIHSFYKKKGMCKGYKDSFPISKEEYTTLILNGKAKSDVEFTEQIFFK